MVIESVFDLLDGLLQPVRGEQPLVPNDDVTRREAGAAAGEREEGGEGEVGEDEAGEVVPGVREVTMIRLVLLLVLLIPAGPRLAMASDQAYRGGPLQALVSALQNLDGVRGISE